MMDFNFIDCLEVFTILSITGTVELLLDNMANFNIKQRGGRGILWAAGAGGSNDVMDLILLFKSKFDLEVGDLNK